MSQAPPRNTFKYWVNVLLLSTIGLAIASSKLLVLRRYRKYSHIFYGKMKQEVGPFGNRLINARITSRRDLRGPLTILLHYDILNSYEHITIINQNFGKIFTSFVKWLSRSTHFIIVK